MDLRSIVNVPGEDAENPVLVSAVRRAVRPVQHVLALELGTAGGVLEPGHSLGRSLARGGFEEVRVAEGRVGPIGLEQEIAARGERQVRAEKRRAVEQVRSRLWDTDPCS